MYGRSTSPWRIIGVVVHIDATVAHVLILFAFRDDHALYVEKLCTLRGRQGRRRSIRYITDAKALYERDTNIMRCKKEGWVFSTMQN